MLGLLFYQTVMCYKRLLGLLFYLLNYVLSYIQEMLKARSAALLHSQVCRAELESRQAKLRTDSQNSVLLPEKIKLLETSVIEVQ